MMMCLTFLWEKVYTKVTFNEHRVYLSVVFLFGGCGTMFVTTGISKQIHLLVIK